MTWIFVKQQHDNGSNAAYWKGKRKDHWIGAVLRAAFFFITVTLSTGASNPLKERPAFQPRELLGIPGASSAAGAIGGASSASGAIGGASSAAGGGAGGVSSAAEAIGGALTGATAGLIGTVLFDFPFNAGTTVGTSVESLSHTYTAQLMNGASISTTDFSGSSDSVQLLSALSQYVQIPSFITGNNGLSIALWFRSDENENFAGLFDFGNGSPADNIAAFIYNNSLGLYVNQPSGSTQYNQNIFPNVNDNVWRHFVWTLSPAGVWTVYINGNSVWSALGQSYPSSISRTKNYIGKSNWNNNNPFFTGAFSDLKMYNSVLGASDIFALYSETPLIDLSFNTDTVVGTLLKNLGSGASMNNAQMMNGASISTSDFGEGLGSVELVGSLSQYIQIPSFVTGNNGISLALWFRSNANGNFAGLFDFNNGAPADTIAAFIYNDGLGLYIDQPTGSKMYTGNICPNVNDNVWHHFVWTLSPAGAWTVFIDGYSVWSALDQLYPASISRTLNYIGKTTWSSNAPFFTGAISDFMLYNSVLGASDILALYSAPETPLIDLSFNTDTVVGALVKNLGSGASVNNAQLMNGASISTTDFGGGLGSVELIGSLSQYIQIPSFVTGNNGISLALWFRSNANQNYAGLFDFDNGALTDTIAAFIYNDGLGLYISQATGSKMYTGNIYSNVNDNVWRHFVWTLSPAGAWTVFIDGYSVWSASDQIYPTSISRTLNYIGKTSWSSNAPFFTGAVSDFLLYNSALGASDILTLYSGNTDHGEEGPESYSENEAEGEHSGNGEQEGFEGDSENGAEEGAPENSGHEEQAGFEGNSENGAEEGAPESSVSCSSHCSLGSCDFGNGLCSQCKTGYITANGNCFPQLSCSTHCSSGFCHFVNGSCSQCQTGYIAYNGNCIHQLPCVSACSSCNPLTGICKACMNGYLLNSGGQCQRSQSCDIHCKSQNLTTCDSTAGICSACQTSYVLGKGICRKAQSCNMHCDSTACNPANGVCSSCATGYTVNAGSCLHNAKCDAHCKTGFCNFRNGSCTQCEYGFSLTSLGQCQKKQSCDVNCASQDAPSCNTVTGACIACSTGYIASSAGACQQTHACNAYCSTSVGSCNRLTGLCLKCVDGYSLTNAGACSPKISCDGNCNSTFCNTANGFCSACRSGYTTTIAGTCQQKQSCPNCLADSCNTLLGQCGKCVPGYTLNTGVCWRQRFCSSHCNSTKCDHRNGWCSDCLQGYTEDRDGNCTTASSRRQLTTSCSQHCSSPASCTISTGKCSKCVSGYVANFLGGCQVALNCSSHCSFSTGSCNYLYGSCSACSDPYVADGKGGCVYKQTCPNCPSNFCTFSSGKCTAACISGYTLNQATGACMHNVNCTANCHSCDYLTGKCTVCATGYLVNSVGGCQPEVVCTSNCANCSSLTGKCSLCAPANKYIANPAGACQYTQNCTNCIDGHCDFITGSCSKCTEGLQPRFGLCQTQQNCSANCATCNLAIGVCQTCTSGYWPNAVGACVQAQSCSQNCSACDYSTGICTACTYGFTLNAVGNCIQNLDCNAQCSAGFCNFITGACSKCSTGYSLTVSGTCSPTQNCSTGCMRGKCNSITGVCSACSSAYTLNQIGACSPSVPCSLTCSNCDGLTGQCLLCKTGYILNAGICQQAFSCSNCLPKACNGLTGVCTTCTAGYILSPSGLCALQVAGAPTRKPSAGPTKIPTKKQTKQPSTGSPTLYPTNSPSLGRTPVPAPLAPLKQKISAACGTHSWAATKIVSTLVFVWLVGHL